ncbi:MAG TPA: hypothetical protein VGH28_29775 [Polyangiaceae bacterium]
MASFILALVAFFAAVPLARADEPARKGLAVLATDGATDAAWPLASAIYGNPELHPVSIDDPRARVLAGERPSSEAKDLAEFAELRAGVKGDDAASRQVLAAIGDKLGVRAIVVVFGGDPPTARVYDVATRAFEAARYEPDAAGAHPTWTAALASIEKPYVAPPPAKIEPGPAPALATVPQPTKKNESKSKAFYESPWFWAAIGAAALITGGILIATTAQTGDTIHLQMRLP